MAKRSKAKRKRAPRPMIVTGISAEAFAERVKAIAEGHIKAHVAATVGRPSRAGMPSKTISVRATEPEIEAWRARAARVKAANLVAWIREVCNGAAGAK